VNDIRGTGGLLSAAVVLTLIPLSILINRLAKRKILTPLAWTLRLGIRLVNLLTERAEARFAQLRSTTSPNTIVANILVTATKARATDATGPTCAAEEAGTA
jgi:hypothetical protein